MMSDMTTPPFFTIEIPASLLIDVVEADRRYQEVCDARQHAGDAHRAQEQARMAVAEAVLVAAGL